MKYVIAIGILILLEEIIEIYYRKSESYQQTLGGVERFFDVPYGIDICNIGSGPGLYAISYDNCDRLRHHKTANMVLEFSRNLENI